MSAKVSAQSLSRLTSHGLATGLCLVTAVCLATGCGLTEEEPPASSDDACGECGESPEGSEPAEEPREENPPPEDAVDVSVQFGTSEDPEAQLQERAWAQAGSGTVTLRDAAWEEVCLTLGPAAHGALSFYFPDDRTAEGRVVNAIGFSTSVQTGAHESVIVEHRGGLLTCPPSVNGARSIDLRTAEASCFTVGGGLPLPEICPCEGEPGALVYEDLIAIHFNIGPQTRVNEESTEACVSGPLKLWGEER